ncbi:MAG: UDP-2,3-diacylglucosamine diphosphatase [Gammaproteobacteria bacterium]|jgi:UDP-2,3-diacylglucosamine hydrolase
MTENSLFISDLHLAPERPRIIGLFERFVDEVAVDADCLYILGDFLEYWIGDDDNTEGLEPVFAALSRLHHADTAVKFMHGNRDFLIGKKLAEQYHFEIIDDPHVEILNGIAVLLMHGDLLCTDDIAYQNFRRKTHNRVIQRLFLSLPLSLRARIATFLRGSSKKATAYKSEDIMDVNQQAVENTMLAYNADILIHGHTHRPGKHELAIDGRHAQRIVLGDWYKDGNYLRINNDKEFELVQFN